MISGSQFRIGIVDKRQFKFLTKSNFYQQSYLKSNGINPDGMGLSERCQSYKQIKEVLWKKK